MKLKEKQAQAIWFADAISGMNGIKFPGAKNASEFFFNSILDEMINPPVKKDSGDKCVPESEINNLLSMFGG